MQVSVKIPTRKEIEPLGVYVPGKPIEEVKREFGLTDIIKLASNENPYGCSELAAQAIVREMEKCALYPEGPLPNWRRSCQLIWAWSLNISLSAMVPTKLSVY